jgi:apolipoprotein N-acyltransferase
MSRAVGYPVAFVAGIVLSLAFPEPSLSFLAWVAFAPLLVAIDRASLGRGYLLAFAFGLGFFGALLFWIVNVGYVAWILLSIMQAGLAGLYGVAWAAASRLSSTVARIVAPGAAWVGLELLRNVVPWGGFTWGELAQSQHDYAWMLRPAAYAGRWAVTFLCVTCAALLVEGWRRRGDSGLRAGAFAGAAVLVIAAPVLLPANDAAGARTRVAIVQGNVPERWTGTAREKEEEILASHVELTRQIDDDALDLVVWPESSVAIDPRLYPLAAQALEDGARSAGVPMIVGGNEDIDVDRYRVVAWLVDEEGAIEDTYVKTHLVPFGEYVPGRRFLQWLPMLAQVPRDAIPDDEVKIFQAGGGAVAPVLSFEGDFGSLVRSRIDAGGRMLLVATNTSTWGRSWASAQHLAMSQVRAVENGVWVIHAALSGISAFVEPDGTVTGRTGLWAPATIIRDVSFSTGPTFYARTGDWFAYGCLLAALALAVAGGRREPVAEPGPAASSVP